MRAVVQTFQSCSRRCQRQVLSYTLKRHLSAGPSSSSSSSSSRSTPIPWFIDPSDVHSPSRPSLRPSTLHLKSPSTALAPLPPSIPPTSIISRLHTALSASPHLEPGALLVREPIPTEIGPPLPDASPKGRRKRGRTYAGEGLQEGTSGIWSWIILAQVRARPFVILFRTNQSITMSQILCIGERGYRKTWRN